MKSKSEKSVVRKLFPLVILIGACALAYFIIVTKPVAERKPPPKIVPQVSSIIVEQGDMPLYIESAGTIIPSQMISLKSQVQGTVAILSEDFKPGEIVKKGTLLLTLDKIDYQAAVLKNTAELAKVKADYELELGQQNIVRTEFQQLQTILPNVQNISAVEKNLALRKPQLEQAKANVSIAEANLNLSKLDLERTEIRAPFDALINTRLVSTGQQITTSESLGELIAIDEYWVEVALPVDTLYNNKIFENTNKNAEIDVITQNNTKWAGSLIQIVGTLSEGSRMGKMLVRVKDPLGLSQAEPHAPLLMGDEVDIRLQAGVYDDVYALPRSAVRNNASVWVIEENILYEKPVNVIWKGASTVYVQSDALADRVEVLTSNLANPVEGMQIRIRGQVTQKTEQPETEQ